MKKSVIAIDGPAGAGKSTIAKMAAKKLNYIYIIKLAKRIGYNPILLPSLFLK